MRLQSEASNNHFRKSAQRNGKCSAAIWGCTVFPKLKIWNLCLYAYACVCVCENDCTIQIGYAYAFSDPGSCRATIRRLQGEYPIAYNA